jgi:hypothetical protein
VATVAAGAIGAVVVFALLNSSVLVATVSEAGAHELPPAVTAKFRLQP